MIFDGIFLNNEPIGGMIKKYDKKGNLELEEKKKNWHEILGRSNS